MALVLPCSTNIAGVSFTNCDGSSRQEVVKHLFTGEQLFLKDESSTEFPEAIGVFNGIGEMIGYLPKTTAQQMRAQNINFQELHCLVRASGRSSNSGVYGATIVIGKTRASVLSLFDDFERRLVEGPNYKPSDRSSTTYTQPSLYQFDFSKVEQKRRTDWGCLIPVIIGVIIAIVIFGILYS